MVRGRDGLATAGGTPAQRSNPQEGNKGSWHVRKVHGGGFLRVLGRDSLGEL
jgi:hypothetical protein